MNGNKAPSPNGFIATFFKTTGEVVGKDMIKAIQFFPLLDSF